MENNNQKDPVVNIEQKGEGVQQEIATTIYEVFIYALMYATIFAYLYEDISYNFILFIMVIVHVFFGLKMNNIFDNTMKMYSYLEQDIRDQKFVITIIPIIAIGSLIIRTLSLSIYTFGYTNANIKSHNLGDKYDPPKKYKIPEESYKLSYIVSTICMFILFLFYFFAPYLILEKNDFDMAYILNFTFITFIAFFFILDNVYTININYQNVLIMIGIIVLILGILLTTKIINDGYKTFLSLLFIITGVISGYMFDIDYSGTSETTISIYGRLYGSIVGYVISLLESFVIKLELDDLDIDNIYILSKSIVGITSGTLIITTIYEMINALEYEKYHHKIEDYKKTEKDDETETDKKKKTFVNTLLNIIIFIVCAFLIFLIFLYAFGVNSQNIIFSGVISLMIATFFSYNSFVSSIISTSF